MAVGQAPTLGHLCLVADGTDELLDQARLADAAVPRIVNRWQTRSSTASRNASSSRRNGRRRPTSGASSGRARRPTVPVTARSRHAATGSAFPFRTAARPPRP